MRKGDEICLDRLQLLIATGINVGLSVKEINRGLKELSKHPSLRKLKIGIELDKSIINQLTQLSNELTKTTQQLSKQSQITDTARQATDKIQASFRAEADAIERSSKALAKNLALREKIVQRVEDLGVGQTRIREDIYTTIGDRFQNVTTHSIRYDGQDLITNPDEFTLVRNPEAYREAQKALQVFVDDANKRIQELTRTFGESSDEINNIRKALSQLAPESSKIDFKRVNDQLKDLEKRKKNIDALKDRIANLRTEIQKFNRADKELPLGKSSEFDKILDSLKTIDVTNVVKANKELDRLERTFKKLNKTASARDGLLQKLNSMRLTGVIDEGRINELETAIRKAESPEQIQRLAKEYGRLYAEQLKIINVEQKKIPLLKAVQELRERGIISEKELYDFENRIASANTRRHIKELEQTRKELQQKEKLIKTNQQLRNSILLQIKALEYNPLARRGLPEIQRFRNELERLNLTAPTTTQRMREIQHALREMAIDFRGVTYKTSTFIGAFQNALIKFPIWMGASTAFFGTVRSIRSAIQNIIEVDTQMTTLARVSGGEIDRVQILRESAELAGKLGNELKAVNEAITDFARQGYRGEGLLALAEAATLFANISELTPEEASSGLTAIVKGFNMLPEEIMVAVDAINEVDNNFAYSSDNIVASITKAVGAAQTFGVTLHELIGHTTAIGEVTRESGNVIGNSLKTIYSRLTTLDASVQALESVGVSVREIRDGVETVRSVSDILADLASRWSSLTSEQQQYIALQIAGRFQLSRFLVLMQQYETAIKATNTALNSQGSGYRENEQYLKSLEARINMLKNAWTDLTLTMGDAVLTDSFVGIVSFLTNVAENLGKVIEQFGLLPSIAFTIVTTYGIASKKFKASILEVIGAIRGKNTTLLASTTAIHRWSASMMGAGTAARALTVSIRGLGVALRGLLIATGVGAAAALVGTAIEGLINNISKAREEAQRMREENEQITDSYLTHRNTINELIERYKALNEIRDTTGLSVEQEQEYFQITKQLADLLPTLISHIDEKGRVHLVSGDALERELRLTKELAKATAELRRQEALDEFAKNEKERSKKLDEIAKKERRIAEQTRVLNTLYERRNELATKGVELPELDEAIKRNENTLRKLRHEHVTLQRELHGIDINAGAYFKAVLEAAAIVSEVEFGGNFKTQLYQIIDAVDLTGVSVEELEKKAFDIINLLKNESLTNEGFLEGLKTIYRESPDVIEAIEKIEQRVKLNKNEFESLIPIIDETGKELGLVKDKSELATHGYELLREVTETLEDGTEQLVYVVREVSNEFVSLAEAIKEPVAEIKNLNQIIDTVNEGKTLTADAVADLILKYPQLASEIEKTTDGYKINADALENLRQIKIQEANDAIQAEVQKTTSTLNSTLERLRAYEIEIDAIQSLADAHNEISKLGVARVFGVEAFDSLEFDDIRKTIAVDGKIADFSSAPEMYERISKSLKTQLEAYRGLVRLGELRESQRVLSELLNDRTYGLSKSSSSGVLSNSLDREFQRYPYYKQKIEDLNAELSSLNKTIEKYANEIQKADKLEDFERRMLLETEYAELLEQRREKYHAIANALRELRDKEILPHFDQLFGNFRRGRNIEDISQVEIQRYLDDLNAQISKTENERVKRDLENKRDLFDYFISLFNDLDKAIKQQSDGWWRDLFENIDTLAKVANEKISNLFKELNSIVSPYDKSIQQLQRQLELLDETDEEYMLKKNNYSLDIIEQYRAQAKAIEIIIQRLQQAKNEYKNIPSQVEKIQQEIEKWQNALDDIPLQIKKINDDLRKQKEDISKKIIDVYKKAYEALRDAEIKAIEDSMKAEEERHRQRMKHLDEEYRRFEDNINAVIKSIDREASEEDYKDELQRLYAERDEIRDRIARLSLSSDMADKAKLLELEKELKNKEYEIEKLQRNRKNELRKQNLQDMLDSKRKEVEGAKKAEEERYQYEKDVLDALKKAREEHWKVIIENEEKYMQIQSNLLSGKLDEIEVELQGFKSSITSVMGAIGQGIANNLIYQLEQALRLLNELRSRSSGSLGLQTAPPYQNKVGDLDQKGFYIPVNENERNIIELMKVNSRLWHETNDQRIRDSYHQSNIALGKTIGATFDGGHWYKNGLRIYHEGGIVGGKGSPLLEKLHKMLNLGRNERLSVVELGELVVRKNPFTQGLKLPSIDFQKRSDGIAQQPMNVIHINIDKVMGDKRSAEEFTDTFIRRLNSKGIRIR